MCHCAELSVLHLSIFVVGRRNQPRLKLELYAYYTFCTTLPPHPFSLCSCSYSPALHFLSLFPDNLWSSLIPCLSSVSRLSSSPPTLQPPHHLPSSFFFSPPSPPAAPLTWEKCFSLIFTSSSTSLCLWAVSSWSLLSASSRLLRSSSNICRRVCTSLSWESRARRKTNRWRGENKK